MAAKMAAEFAGLNNCVVLKNNLNRGYFLFSYFSKIML